MSKKILIILIGINYIAFVMCIFSFKITIFYVTPQHKKLCKITRRDLIYSTSMKSNQINLSATLIDTFLKYYCRYQRKLVVSKFLLWTKYSSNKSQCPNNCKN